MILTCSSKWLNRYGLVTIDAACAVSGGKPNTVTKELAQAHGAGHPGQGSLHPSPLLLAPGGLSEPRASSSRRPCSIGACSPSRVSGRPRAVRDRQPSSPATRSGKPSSSTTGRAPRFIAKKLARWCSAQDLAGLTALGIVVPTEAKAQSINGAMQDLPLPLRFTISEDLWSLSCATARR